MPREYDFGAKPTREQYRVHGLFVPLEEGRGGHGETSSEERFGGLEEGTAAHAQFEYKPSDGLAYYDNGSLDPVFQWLGENATGSWHWHEDCVNNYRSLVVTVWLESLEDVEAFGERWADRFALRPWALERNAELERVQASKPAGPGTP